MSFLDHIKRFVREADHIVVLDGGRAAEHYTRLRPDLAFVGCNGLHAAFGLSTPDPIEAVVKTAIIQTSRRVVVLCDSAKHDQETLMRFASLDEVDTPALILDLEDAVAPDAKAEARDRVRAAATSIGPVTG